MAARLLSRMDISVIWGMQRAYFWNEGDPLAAGRVTLLERLRKRLGIRAGAVLDCEQEEGKLVARNVEGDPVESVYGILALDRSTDALLEELRGARGV
jgi:hypothetical protein